MATKEPTQNPAPVVTTMAPPSASGGTGTAPVPDEIEVVDTIDPLEARAKALAEREAALAQREKEAEMLAAEANLALREAELEKLEAGLVHRSRPVRGDVRTDAVTSPIRGRQYKGGDMPNEFEIPLEDIPAGQSYQWNNHTVFGERFPHHEAFMAKQGWEPVPTSRHPHLMPVGTPPNEPIIVRGQILVERPLELTKEALQEGLDKARGEVRMKEEQLYGAPPGTMQRSRDNGSNDFIRLNKQIEPGTPAKGNYQYEVPGAGLPIE